MTKLNWNISQGDDDIVANIVMRAKALDHNLDLSTLTMDLVVTHLNGTPLKLMDFFHAPKIDFMHDIYGIMRHVNRETGAMGDCFIPRYAA